MPEPLFCDITTCASKSGSRHFSRAETARPSSAAEPPASTKSLAQAWAIAPTTSSIPVSWMSATSLRPLMPPAALHQEVNTLAVVTSWGSFVKPSSVRTPTMIWLAVTPLSGLPVALPPWQTFVREPKLAPAVVACDDGDDAAPDVAAGPDAGVLLDPARLQPAATRAVSATAAALMAILTGFLLESACHTFSVTPPSLRSAKVVTRRLWHAFFQMRMMLP